MGGRGSSFGQEKVSLSAGLTEGKAKRIPVAGMTPTDRGARFTNEEKTLAYIEHRKIEKNLKVEQVQIIDEYGYVTRAFEGDRHSCGIDADTSGYCRGRILTHNHPDDYGGTFSQADIGCLSLGPKELRASSKEGTYSLRAKKTANPEKFYEAYERGHVKMQEQIYEIARKNADKKWPSEKKYRYENRKEQLEVVHQWYQKEAKKYGYEYTFTPREGA